MAERSSLVRLQQSYLLELDWRGFELHPETPTGGLALAELFPAERLRSMQGYLAQLASRFGIERLATPARMPNTRRALALAERAREAGRLDAFREAAMALYWEAGEDLERDAVLRRTAADAGLEPEAALAAADDARYLARIDAIRAEAAERGVRGIPTFFFGDQPPVVGCQSYEALARAAERAGAERRELR